MTQDINTGDGSMQMRLDAGRCPKCDAVLNLHKADGTIQCSICSLQIMDTTTWIAPTEQEISAGPNQMQWSDAVQTIENLIEEYLTEQEGLHGPNPEIGYQVRKAWKRILAG